MLDIKIADQIKSKLKNCVIASLQADILVKPSDNLLIQKLIKLAKPLQVIIKLKIFQSLQLLPIRERHIKH